MPVDANTDSQSLQHADDHRRRVAEVNTCRELVCWLPPRRWFPASLQRGEPYNPQPYALFMAMDANFRLHISYDICCQWNQNCSAAPQHHN
ncbi:hypothetical protein DFH06DRAFT_1342284 [Mycena polygramma]|nr:hypothetical protein DFH06DRAFT_1342284 [Mycena polygramma]